VDSALRSEQPEAKRKRSRRREAEADVNEGHTDIDDGGSDHDQPKGSKSARHTDQLDSTGPESKARRSPSYKSRKGTLGARGTIVSRDDEDLGSYDENDEEKERHMTDVLNEEEAK